MHCREILFTPRCSPRARKFPRSVNFSVQRTVVELRGVKVAQLSDFVLSSPYKTPKTYFPVTSLQSRGYIAIYIWSYPKASIHLKIWGCPASPLIPSSPFSSPSPPSFPFHGRPHPLNQLEGLGSAVSSPSGVWGKAPVDKRFGAYLGQKEQLCFVYLSL